MIKKESNSIQAFWVALGAFSSFSLSIISAMILSRYFDKIEYGTYRQIVYVYNTLLVVFSAGLPRVFSYYLPRYSKEEGKDITIKISLILFFTGFLFSLFLFLASDLIATLLHNPQLTTGLKYFSPIPMLLLPTMGVEGIFASYKQTKYTAVYTTLSRLLMLLFIVLPVVVFGSNYLFSVYGWIVASFVTLLLAIYFKGIPFKDIKAKKTSLKMNEIFSYSIPLLFASLGGIAMKSADQFYISRYFGTREFAEFSNGFIELPIVGMITFSIGSVLMPLFSKMVFDERDKDEIITLWQKALMKSAMIIYPLVLFFIFYANEVITILYTSDYIASSSYFRIALVLNFFNVIMFAPILLSLGETKFYSKILIYFAIIAWIGDFLVIKLFYSPFVLAIFSVTKSILLALIAFRKTSKVIGVSFFKVFPLNKLFIIFLHSLLSILIVEYLINSIFENGGNLFVLGLLFMCYILLLIVTSKYFRLNYLQFLEPIFKKLNLKRRVN